MEHPYRRPWSMPADERISFSAPAIGLSRDGFL